MGRTRASASRGPDIMIDSVPSPERSTPPETGASTTGSPCSAIRTPKAAMKEADTVAHGTSGVPRAMPWAAPSAPSTAASTCAALTTKATTASAPVAASRAVAAALIAPRPIMAIFTRRPLPSSRPGPNVRGWPAAGGRLYRSYCRSISVRTCCSTLRASAGSA